MSQYPSPYQPPTPQNPTLNDYYQPGGGDVLGPNRWAAGMMFVVAAITLIGAFCCAGVGAMVPAMMADNPEKFAEFNAQFPQVTPGMLRGAMIVLAVITLALAVAMIVLGVFVRRGSKAAVIASIVLVILLLLYMVVNMIIGLAGQGQPPAQLALSVCVMVIPMALLAIVLMLLFRALRSSDQAGVMRDQHVQQYWQYAYQQQLYAQQQQQQPSQFPASPPQQQPPPAPPASPAPPQQPYGPGDSDGPASQG
jgi:hypothetical protein